jgi:hypothetical protein
MKKISVLRIYSKVDKIHDIPNETKEVSTYQKWDGGNWFSEHIYNTTKTIVNTYKVIKREISNCGNFMVEILEPQVSEWCQNPVWKDENHQSYHQSGIFHQIGSWMMIQVPTQGLDLIFEEILHQDTHHEPSIEQYSQYLLSLPLALRDQIQMALKTYEIYSLDYYEHLNNSERVVSSDLPVKKQSLSVSRQT